MTERNGSSFQRETNGGKKGGARLHTGNIIPYNFQKAGDTVVRQQQCRPQREKSSELVCHSHPDLSGSTIKGSKNTTTGKLHIVIAGV